MAVSSFSRATNDRPPDRQRADRISPGGDFAL
jgi:hypothetical protein